MSLLPEAVAAIAAPVVFSGSVWIFGVSQSGSYFGTTSSDFVETIVRAGANVFGDAADFTLRIGWSW